MTSGTIIFGIALLLAVLTSALASRSPLSTTTVFLAVGLVVGPLGFGWVRMSAGGVETAAEVALFAILFTDGQHAPLSVLRRRWKEPARALWGGMPVTLVIVAALGHWIAGLGWPQALVLGAVLAPTDPVFASALVGREDVPRRVRDLLNIESGLNDGIALPAVLLLVGFAGGQPHGWSTDIGPLLLQIGEGVVLGVLLPVVIAQVLRLPGVGAAENLEPLGPLATGILLFGCCHYLGANQFLAAFAAGSTIATLRPQASEAFRHTGELLSELAKGGALLAFATLVDRDAFTAVGIAGVAVAVLALAVSRPAPVMAVLVGTDLTWRERAAVAWFGPKGFASVAYAVIVASAHLADSAEIVALVTITVLLSVVAHSSTDVVVARALSRLELSEDGAVIGGPHRPEHRA